MAPPSIQTLVIADSRGKGLQECIKGMNKADQIRVVASRGAGMVRATEGAYGALLGFRPDLVILVAGICDVTTRDSNSKQVKLRHTNPVIAVNYAMDQVRRATGSIRDAGFQHISLATYTGLDLSRYNRVTGEIPHNDQELLNEIILKINNHIIEANKEAGMSTTWTGGAVHPCLKKKYRCRYARLSDGCHLSEQTRAYWARQILKTMGHHPFKPT